MKEDLTELENMIFTYENDEEKALEIETGVYKNGNKIKRIKVSDDKYAIVRELLGKDMKEADLLSGGKQEDYLPAMMALSTKINGQKLTLEEYDLMKAKLYTKIKTAVGLLNF